MKPVSFKAQKVLLFIPVINFSIGFIWVFVNSRLIEKWHKKSFIAALIFIAIATPFGIIANVFVGDSSSSLTWLIPYLMSIFMFAPLVYMQKDASFKQVKEKQTKKEKNGLGKTKNILLILFCLFIIIAPLFVYIFIFHYELPTEENTTIYQATISHLSQDEYGIVRIYTNEGHILELTTTRGLNFYFLYDLHSNDRVIFRLYSVDVPLFHEYGIAHIVSLESDRGVVLCMETMYNIEMLARRISLIFYIVLLVIIITVTALVMLRLNGITIFSKCKQNSVCEIDSNNDNG